MGEGERDGYCLSGSLGNGKMLRWVGVVVSEQCYCAQRHSILCFQMATEVSFKFCMFYHDF